MRVDVTRQPGKPGFFRMERSKDFEDRMFVSAPYTSEITRDEAMSLIEALIMKAEEIWPEGDELLKTGFIECPAWSDLDGVSIMSGSPCV